MILCSGQTPHYSLEIKELIVMGDSMEPISFCMSFEAGILTLMYPSLRVQNYRRNSPIAGDSGFRVIGPRRHLPFSAGIAVALTALLTLVQPCFSNPLYWDTNGSVTGSGNLGGVWGTDDFWSLDADGLLATGAYVSGNAVVFAAGVDGTGTYTVTLSSNQTSSGLNFEEGHVTIAPTTAVTTANFATIQILTLSGVTPTIAVQNMDSVITARMTASGLTKTGFGKLTLDFAASGSASYFNLGAAAITIQQGTLELKGTGASANQLSSSSGIVINSGGTFLWNTGANSMSDNARITVNTGGILNTRTNDQFGTIEGSGTIVMRGASMNLAHGNITTNFSGLISGSGTIQMNGGTSFVSLSNANTFTGTVTASNANFTAGGLRLAHARAAQNALVSLVNLDVTRSNISFASGIGSFLIGSLQGTSNLTLQDAGGGAITLQVGNNDASTSYRGALSGSGGLMKIGMGTLTLTGEQITVTRSGTSGPATYASNTSHTYTGDTTIIAGAHNPNSGTVTQANAGGIKLDFNASAIANVISGTNTYSYTVTAPTSDIISASSRLVLGGGKLWVSGRNTGTDAVSQTFNNTHLLTGRSYVTVTQGTAATGTVVNLGDITHVPGGVLEFTLPAGVQSLTNGVTTTTANDASGILGGWAIVGTDWAVKDTAGIAIGNVVAASSGAYTAYTSGDIVSSTTSNLLINNGAVSITTASGITDINTLMVRNDAGNSNAAVSRVIDIAAGEILRLGANGSIWNQGSFVTSTVPNLIIGTGNNVGVLTAGGAPDTAGEIVLNNSGGGEMVIRSSIQDNGTGAVTLIRTGSGNQVVLSGTNTHSGGTILTQGRTRFDNVLALGSGPVTVVAGGQLWLNSAGTYAQNFFLSGTGYGEGNVPGAIRFSGGQNLSGQINLVGDTRVGAVNAGTATTLSGKITGDYALDLSGFSGGTNVIIVSNSTNDFSGNFSLNTNLGITPAAFSNTNIVTVRLGASEVIPNGLHKGNLVLSGGNSGGTTTLDLNGYNETVNSLISYGTHSSITITNSAAGTTSTLSIGDNHSTAIVTDTAASSTFFGGAIKDNGTGLVALTKIGEGTQTLTGANTYSGITTISKGILQAGATNTLSANSDLVLADDPTAVLALTDGIADYSQTIKSLSGGGTVNLGTIAAADTQTTPGTRLTTGSDADTTYRGNIVGTGGIVKQSTGRLILSGSNTYVGTTTISDGTLQIGDGGTAGTLGSGAVINEAALVFNRSDTLDVDNTISGAGTLTQSGSGTTVLTAVHSYTGNTYVDAGTLKLESATSNNNIASSEIISVKTSATLDVNGISTSGGFQVGGSQLLSGESGGGGTVSGASTILTGGSVAGGTDGAVGTLSFDSGLTTNGGSMWLVDLVGSASPGLESGDRIIVNGGALTIGSGTNLMITDVDWNNGNTFTIATYSTLTAGSKFTFGMLELNELDTFSTSNGQYQIRYGDGSADGITLTAVPEPSTLVLLAVGLGGWALARRRRQPGNAAS